LIQACFYPAKCSVAKIGMVQLGLYGAYAWKQAHLKGPLNQRIIAGKRLTEFCK